jgi:hypothetical protein
MRALVLTAPRVATDASSLPLQLRRISPWRVIIR